jgi:multisubunit Na+/H+ antiporter MnhB subunit
MITSPLTVLVARVVTAPILIVALATLVRGYKGVGDGFAGGLIAALAVLLQYPAFGPDGARRLLPVHRAPQVALAGLFGALVLAVAPLAWGDPVLTHAPAPGTEPAHVGSIDIATAFAYDVAIFVLVLGVVVAIFDALAHAAMDDDETEAAE